jgi:hypothetical protein
MHGLGGALLLFTGLQIGLTYSKRLVSSERVNVFGWLTFCAIFAVIGFFFVLL